MPAQFDNFTKNDIVSTTTMLHEVIPITASIVSGTYGDFTTEGNIKNYTHGMFQSVYDYPYLSSSSNHIFDLTVGYDESSVCSGSTSVQNAKKINMYNQLAQTSLGYSGSSNTVKMFELDKVADEVGKAPECLFITLGRLITKDQIKVGSVNLQLGTGSFGAPFRNTIKTLTDTASSDTAGTFSTIAGDCGLLLDSVSGLAEGLVFYQQGTLVLGTGSFVNGTSDFYVNPTHGSQSIRQTLTGSSITGSCNALRHRIYNLSYNNTTEINSTIYFCGIPANSNNFSTNRTYTSGGKIVVKNVPSDSPVTYITTVGLYNANNELLATAKLSEPLKKDPSNELTLRLRLDY